VIPLNFVFQIAPDSAEHKMEILTGNPDVVPTHSPWKLDLKRAFRNLEELLEYVEVAPAEVAGLSQAGSQFGVFATRSYASRIRKGDPFDPLLLQIVPRNADSSFLANEMKPQENPISQTGVERPSSVQSDWSLDPVGDATASRIPGLLHKYAGRVLLVLTGACAIHCRYCFRQHFDYSAATRHSGKRDAHSSLATAGVANHRWRDAMEYIGSDPTISEVILSGGDPLMVTDNELKDLVEHVSAIPHVQHLRIHTRMPVVLPNRITPSLLKMLQETDLVTRVVLHVNHANEMDELVAAAVGKIRQTDTVVMNQAVLLKDVNDSFQAQLDLSKRLIQNQVLPYYLHLLDQVRGGEPFFVSDQHAKSIHLQLLANLPGYAVPKLVREVAGEPNKRPVV
jgi:L-lysine 2,3-aminomutase